MRNSNNAVIGKYIGRDSNGKPKFVWRYRK
jgi:hypothetical protein